MGGLNFKELAKERIKKRRNIVISEAFNKSGNFVGYSIAEQFIADEEGKKMGIFLNGGLGILDKQGLAHLKLAVDKACEESGITEQTLCDIIMENEKKE